ncbi:hypothetical protein PG985_003924 [Apiospora marii]|uniref:uncharacterized protein n=1 Tax=Apiospora marii TaxID=335849 RepID=UPI003130E7E5
MVLHRICNSLIKVAFLLFYLRLFGPVRQVRIMVWIGLGLVATFCIVYIIIELATCIPRPSDHDGFLDDVFFERCFAFAPKILLAGCYFGVIMDFYILLLPLSQLKGLGLPKKRKIGISFIFLTGLIYIEVSMGLVCLSLPVMLALFVSRITDLGRTLSSWVRRSREHLASGESTSSLTPAGSRAAAPELPQHVPGSGLPGLRKFIRNLNRSRAQQTEPGTVMSTFNDLTTADMSYHAQLKKTLKPSQAVRNSSNKYEKFG